MATGRGAEGLEVGIEFLGVGDGFGADEVLSVSVMSMHMSPQRERGEGLLLWIKARNGDVFSTEVGWATLLNS